MKALLLCFSPPILRLFNVWQMITHHSIVKTNYIHKCTNFLLQPTLSTASITWALGESMAQSCCICGSSWRKWNTTNTKLTQSHDLLIMYRIYDVPKKLLLCVFSIHCQYPFCHLIDVHLYKFFTCLDINKICLHQEAVRDHWAISDISHLCFAADKWCFMSVFGIMEHELKL